MEKPIKSFPVPSEEEPLVLMVTGSRKHTNRAFIKAVLDSFLLYAHPNRPYLIEGGAEGTDKIARDWAWANKVPCTTFEADWGRYGRRAGPIRNSRMLDSKPSMMLAFPLGSFDEKLSRGTYNAIEIALNRGIPTAIFRADPATHKIISYQSYFQD